MGTELIASTAKTSCLVEEQPGINKQIVVWKGRMMEEINNKYENQIKIERRLGNFLAVASIVASLFVEFERRLGEMDNVTASVAIPLTLIVGFVIWVVSRGADSREMQARDLNKLENNNLLTFIWKKSKQNMEKVKLEDIDTYESIYRRQVDNAESKLKWDQKQEKQRIRRARAEELALNSSPMTGRTPFETIP